MSVFAEEEKKKEKNVKPVVQAKETVQRDLSEVNGPEGGMLPEAVSAKIQSKRGTGQRLSDHNLQQYSIPTRNPIRSAVPSMPGLSPSAAMSF